MLAVRHVYIKIDLLPMIIRMKKKSGNNLHARIDENHVNIQYCAPILVAKAVT